MPVILRDPNARPVIGHRGNRAHAPENTLPSLLEAVALGVDGLEFDLHISKDGVLVLMHDVTLDRTTNGRGPVAGYTLSELRTFDAGARFTKDGSTFPWQGRGVSIPTFDEVIEALPRALPLIIELKTPAAAPFLLDAVRKHNLADRIIVAGFDPAATRPLRNQGFWLGASTPDVASLLLPALFGRSIERPWFQALCIPPMYNGIPVPIAALARATKPFGNVTHVWTVNDPAHAQRLWRKGVNGIISDDPGLMIAARKGI